MMGETKYVAIIGDLRHSRRSSDRAGLQRRLLAAIELVNSGETTGLVVPAAMTAGDEAQALVSTGEAAMHVFDALSDAARPSRFTFGFGMGTLSTDLNPNVALIDGPAFHAARAALESARSTGVGCAAGGFGPLDEPLSALLGLLSTVRSRWTDRQVEFITLAKQVDRRIDIAKAEDVSPSVVTESLQAAAFEEYRQGVLAAANLADRALRGSREES